MEGYCSTGQSPQWAVVPVEEEEELAAACILNRGKKGRAYSIMMGIELSGKKSFLTDRRQMFRTVGAEPLIIVLCRILCSRFRAP
jgi:hypothetical protein